MTRDELEARLRSELGLPFYNAKVANRDYSEDEYQAMKAELEAQYLKYVDDYIDNAENDV